MNHNFQIKIFKIKREHYQLRGNSFKKSVKIIIENHKKHIHANKDDMDIFNIQYEEGERDGYQFASYCYNQPIESHHWRLFLPDYIAEGQDFRITKFSYVLFIFHNKNIYCVIGGSGISVIKAYINSSFGIDVYSRICKLSEDLVIEIKSRSIANNVSLQSTTYNYNQTVSDTIEFSEIPTVMKIVIREELKKTFFKQFNLDSSQAILEIGSYFCLKKSISFEELLNLIKEIDYLIENVEPTDLSFFKKIEDENTLVIIEDELLKHLISNIKNFNFNRISSDNRNDIDIVHPSKLVAFYECSSYKIRYKNSRDRNEKIVYNRKNLYLNLIGHIYERLENNFEDFNIKTEIYKTQIKGLKNHLEVTHGTFLDHIIAEITFNEKKYFKIDRNWYIVKDDYLQKLNDAAKDYYTRYEWKNNILQFWPNNLSEGEYNLLHNGPNTFVMDKLLIDNIELCDILHLEDNTLSFIHVKDGFDVKLRDCYIQVVLASKRLKLDLSDQNGNRYLIPTLKKYNRDNAKNQIDIDGFSSSLKKENLEIVFILAYKNRSLSNLPAIEKIDKSDSNIAKYSIVNVVKGMNDVYPIRLKDISTISEN